MLKLKQTRCDTTGQEHIHKKDKEHLDKYAEFIDTGTMIFQKVKETYFLE